MATHPDCIAAAQITKHPNFLNLGDPDHPSYSEAYVRLCGQIARGEPIASSPAAEVDPLELVEDGDRPGFLTRVVTFAGAVAQHVAGGLECVSREEYEARLATCEPCEYRKAGQCTVCTCQIRIKAWSAALDCPKGFWPKLGA